MLYFLKLVAIGLCVFYLIIGLAIFFYPWPTQEIVICSEMQGKLTFQGKPASGAKIVRWSAWKDHEGESETFHADEHGYFFLPEKRDILKRNPMNVLSQFVGRQVITVTFNGADYEIWRTSKLEPEKYAEYGGRPTNLRCELTDEQEIWRTGSTLGGVSCKWDLAEEH